MPRKNPEVVKSPLEKEIIKIVAKQQKELTRRDMKEIVKEIMPDIDRLIATCVKDHFTALADYINNSFKS